MQCRNLRDLSALATLPGLERLTLSRLPLLPGAPNGQWYDAESIARVLQALRAR